MQKLLAGIRVLILLLLKIKAEISHILNMEILII